MYEIQKLNTKTILHINEPTVVSEKDAMVKFPTKKIPPGKTAEEKKVIHTANRQKRIRWRQSQSIQHLSR